MAKNSTLKYTILSFSLILSFIAGGFVWNKVQTSPITSEIIASAERLIGIEFNNTQRDSMVNVLNDRLQGYRQIRALKMPNSIVPSLNFNPIPVGFVAQDKTNGFKLSKINPVKLPANKNDLAFYTIRQLSELLRTRQITSVQLTKFYIERLKKYDPKLLFVISYTEERALKEAAQADAEIKAGKYRGVLHGVPYGVKDLLSTTDSKTTFGASPYKDQHLDVDASVVKRLHDAGAVLVAKLTLGELAMGDTWFGGMTRNPWDISRGSSGSSAGPASAVSAGCLPFAIGSETLGSIVSPSTECGDTGLRPSFGRVSKYGAMALSWSMDKLGPITRSVEDCAIVFNAIQGTDGKDLSTIAAPFNYDGTITSLKGWKIGYAKASFDSPYDNKTNDSLTLAKLKALGAELIPIKKPDLPIGAITMMLNVEAGAAFQELVLNHKDDMLVKQLQWSWPNTFRAAQLVPAVEYLQASRARTLLIQQWYERLKGLDIYITPTFYSYNLSMSNLTGNPCVVLPNGFNKEGRPMSITFMGQLFGEGKTLEAARIYQQGTNFNQKHPSLNF